MLDFVKCRNIDIDLLRFIGLSMIILAHVQPPEFLFQIRAFDVPLMLFVSGLAFSGRKPDFSRLFFWNRLKRLVTPVYIFLTLYFTIVFIAQTSGMDFGVTMDHIIGSYLLMDGIGFVWVIRVFLLVGLLTPFFLTFDKRIKSDTVFFVIWGAILAVIEIFLANRIGIENTILREFVYYAIGYGLVFVLGLRFSRISKKTKATTLAIVSICYITLQLLDNYKSGGVISVNNFKYPPRSLFLLYGITLSFIAIFIAKRISNKIRIPSWIIFIGQNTIWIYLYHIPLIQITGMMQLPWGIRYFTVYSIAAFIVYIQNVLVFKFKFPFHKYFVG